MNEISVAALFTDSEGTLVGERKIVKIGEVLIDRRNGADTGTRLEERGARIQALDRILG